MNIPLTAKIATTTMLLVASAACGGSDSESSDRARTITAPSASAEPEAPEGDGDRTLTEAELTAALLTVADLPTGYTAAASSEDDESETEAEGECQEKFESLSAAEGDEAASAEASFEGGGLGTVLEQGLESYEDEGTLEKRFDDVVSVLSDCPTFSTTEDDGTTTEFKVAALSFPKLGDDTVALAITGTTPDFSIAINVAIVRLGRNVMSVIQGGLTADAAVLEQASRTGLDKLAAATG